MIARKTIARVAVVGGLTLGVLSIPSICSWWACDSAPSDRSGHAVQSDNGVVAPAQATVTQATTTADAKTSGKTRARAVKARTLVPLERRDFAKFKMPGPAAAPTAEAPEESKESCE